MRTAVAVAVGLVAAGVATAQEPPPPRYGVELNARGVPQGSPKEALASALRQLELGRYEYLLAHLLDPATVDARVAERARSLAAAAENDLRALRNRQKADPLAYTAEQRLPDNPELFNARVAAEATARGFQKLADEVRGRFAEDPNLLRELRRFLREGELNAHGDTATLTLKGVPGRAVRFRKVDNRWFVDDRTEPAKAAGKPAEGS